MKKTVLSLTLALSITSLQAVPGENRKNMPQWLQSVEEKCEKLYDACLDGVIVVMAIIALPAEIEWGSVVFGDNNNTDTTQDFDYSSEGSLASSSSTRSCSTMTMSTLTRQRRP